MQSNKTPGVYPLAGKALDAGVLPEHFYRDHVEIQHPDGSSTQTCHLSTDGTAFQLDDVFGAKEWREKKIQFQELSYVDDRGVMNRMAVRQHDAMVVTDNFEFGFATKINGLRWGFKITINKHMGVAQILTDNGSPIRGLLFHFV